MQKKIRIKQKIKLKSIKKLRATIAFDDNIAIRFHDTRYYEALDSEIKNLPIKQDLKRKFRTRQRKEVTDLIEKYKGLYFKKAEGIFNQLSGIYNRQRAAAFNKVGPNENFKVTNLLYLVSSVPMLAVAYKKIRKNKGAMTLGWMLSDDRYNRRSSKQKSFLNKTFGLPNGMSRYILKEASRLLRMGKYPWGASKRVYVPKPGRPDTQRPITIPPFMDRVVQCSIKMVLEAIYEPWFEASNCSFGFRPHKGVHDAIWSIAHSKNNGLNYAIEGDIKSAYDKVSKEKLINILEKSIQDKRFINLLKQRLDYQFFDTISQKYVVEKDGLPQGGIDSPYLWNIYMMEFDNFVNNETESYFNTLNKNIKVKSSNSLKRAIERRRYCCKWLIQVLNKLPNKHNLLNNIIGFATPKVRPPGIPFPSDILGRKELLEAVDWKNAVSNKTDTNKVKHNLIKIYKKLTHDFLNLPQDNSSKKKLRFHYVRYADDWIVLTNAPEEINKVLKEKYKQFLFNDLSATLADDKTFITNLKIKPAHFLGFQISCPRGKKVGWYKRQTALGTQTIKANITGSRLRIQPDKTRLINRMFMKAYCDKSGFPREIGWLSHLEPHIIIERFNSVIQGFANFYAEFIDYPQAYLGRWFYILRYSCLKTLAQKFKTSIKKIFNKYKTQYYTKKNYLIRNKISRFFKTRDSSKTVEIPIQLKINGKTYDKTWRLLTTKEALANALLIKRKPIVRSTYQSLRNGVPSSYIREEGTPSITTDDYLDKIRWVNLRTQASLDFPCSICGSDYRVEMHHLKHVRKTRYELIPGDKKWEQLMSLRNRKQIPVCRECHTNIIHKGKYGGQKLSYFEPQVYYDGRILTLESHIHAGPKLDYTKSLEERGWKVTD